MVSVFRIEYEIIPSMNPWVAFIAAFSHEQAYKHLQRVVNKPIKITSSGMMCRLDDVSAEVRKNIIDAYLGAFSKTAVGKEVTEEEESEVPDASKPEKKKIVIKK